MFTRIQDNLACTVAAVMASSCWSCVSGEGLGYRSVGVFGGTSTTIISKQFAHRGSSSLFVRKPARLGNPEDRT